MPRAENRKKPTNQSGGGMKQGGFQNKQSNGAGGGAFGNAQSKKQELIEKVRKQQEQKSQS